MIKVIGEKTKTVNYNPKWQIVTVNRKINSRFFSIVNNGGLANPISGSFITDDIDKSNTFQLVPQFVNSGTATPTKFTVMNENSGISNEALISYTYEQSFNYYNWEGAVRVPAVLQYANELAKFASENIGGNIEDDK